MIRRSRSFALLSVLLATTPALARDAGICQARNLLHVTFTGLYFKQ
jgi:hypothetical protein